MAGFLSWVTGAQEETEFTGKLHLVYGANGSLNLGYVASAEALSGMPQVKATSSIVSSIASALHSVEEKLEEKLERDADGGVEKVEEKLEDLLDDHPPADVAPKADVEAVQVAPSPEVKQAAEPAVVEAKREPALMQPDPTDLPSKAPSALDGPTSFDRPQSISPSKDESNQPTAPASPEGSSPGRLASASRGNSTASEAAAPKGRFGWPGIAAQSKAGQTSAYQALSTNEYVPTHLTANTGASESSHGDLNTVSGPLGNRLFPSPTPLIVVGSQRKRLREHFNLKEIDVELIFHRFDADQSNQLEQKEFRALLTAFIGRKAGNLRDDEYRFVMAVADKDRNECISKRELLYGLQAWYAFNFMPIEVNSALKKYRISPEGCRMPSQEVLRGLLVDLNGFIDVDPEEINVVRRAALALGATEERVTMEQLRRAVAVWYINIERSHTNTRRLIEHSVSRLGVSIVSQSSRFLKKIPKLVGGDDLEQGPMDRPAPPPGSGPGQALMRGDDDDFRTSGQEENHQFCCGLVFAPLIAWLLVWILPGLYMVHVAGWFPTPPACEHDLAWLITLKGFLCMFTGFSGLLYHVVHDGQFRTALQIGGFVAVVIFLIQNFVGFGLVINSNPAKCGGYLFNANQFFFVWSIFWFPFFWCTLCGCHLGANVLFDYLAILNKELALGTSANSMAPAGVRAQPNTRE